MHIVILIIAALIFIIFFIEVDGRHQIAVAQAELIRAQAQALLIQASIPIYAIVGVTLVLLVLSIGWTFKKYNEFLLTRKEFYLLKDTPRRQVWNILGRKDEPLMIEGKYNDRRH